jgi:PAS domain S-box-containing protein
MNFGNFIPHGFCLAWDPGLVWLQAGSDVLIAAAYYSIPAALLVFLGRRRDLAFRPIFGLFATFILACGTTHLLGVITLFVPVYWTDGVIKAITAALSIATAIMLWPLLPKALALPSPAALATLNEQLALQIEERDQSAARLRASEQRLRELYARSPAILHATDPSGILLEVSQRWLDLFGLKREQVIGRNITEFYAPGTVEDCAGELATLMTSPVHAPRERRIVLSSGETRDAEAIYTVERNASGGPSRILVALTDVTLRKQAESALRESEERLRQAQKMEAVGQLTGGIAHDFNNLLTTIMASLELLEQRGQLDARSQRIAGNALEGARRAARLTSQLLSFSRRSRLAPESLDPETAIQGIAELLAQTAGSRIRLSIAMHGASGDAAEPAAAPLWPIMADRNQLEAAVLNLVINARDAIHGDGEIAITFANRTITAAQAATIGPEPVQQGDYVGITVTDTGAGMPPEVQARALEPFFTTKPSGAGTGLGLSQTYGFATQSGGTIRIRSAPGLGTAVEILLPRATVDAVPHVAASPLVPAEGKGEIILVAEDDALLRHTVSEVLRGQGYTVETAGNGQAALALLRSLNHVDLLLTDIMMPGMNGVELATAARALMPRLRIMFATGFSDQRVLAQWPETLDVVNKPFALDHLIGRVNACLRTPHAAPPSATGVVGAQVTPGIVA